jgi:integrase
VTFCKTNPLPSPFSSWKNSTFHTLTVTQSLRRVGGRLQLLPLKTKQSARTVNLPKRAVAALRRQAVRQKEEQLRAGPDWAGNTDNLVFTSLRGTPLEPRNASARHFKKMLTKAGIAPHRFNDARHTAATLLLDDGANIKQVQALLGHSRISTTLDVYVHHTPAARDDTAARMDAILADSRLSEATNGAGCARPTRPRLARPFSL